MSSLSAKYSQFVMPDHINVVGTLFGGQMIAWVDLAAAKVAYRFLKSANVDGAVTRTIDQVEFKEPVYLGDWGNFMAMAPPHLRSKWKPTPKVETVNHDWPVWQRL